MITEEMLRTAAAEAGQALCDSLPAPESCTHRFSERFERKMKQTIWRERHPAVYRFLHRAACFLLVLTLGGTSWLAVDVQARAAFVNWVRYQYESFTEYRFAGEAPSAPPVRYEPTWVPDGYQETIRQDEDGLTVRGYVNEDDRMIHFMCSQGSDATSLFLVSDSAVALKTQVGGLPADYYQEPESDAASALVWMSEDGETMFCITAALPEEALVRMAESVAAAE